MSCFIVWLNIKFDAWEDSIHRHAPIIILVLILKKIKDRAFELDSLISAALSTRSPPMVRGLVVTDKDLTAGNVQFNFLSSWHVDVFYSVFLKKNFYVAANPASMLTKSPFIPSAPIGSAGISGGKIIVLFSCPHLLRPIWIKYQSVIMHRLLSRLLLEISCATPLAWLSSHNWFWNAFRCLAESVFNIFIFIFYFK